MSRNKVTARLYVLTYETNQIQQNQKISPCVILIHLLSSSTLVRRCKHPQSFIFCAAVLNLMDWKKCCQQFLFKSEFPIYKHVLSILLVQKHILKNIRSLSGVCSCDVRKNLSYTGALWAEISGGELNQMKEKRWESGRWRPGLLGFHVFSKSDVRVRIVPSFYY